MEDAQSPWGRGTRGDATRQPSGTGSGQPPGRSGKGHAARSAPYSPGTPAPSIRPAGLLRAAAAEEASKPRGPWPGRGKGKHPGARTQGSRATPRGRCRAREKGLERALWSGAGWFQDPPGPRTLPGPLSAPGGGVAGPARVPAPQHKQAPDAEPPGSAVGGGGTRWGPGRLVTPPCPGLAAQNGGGANPLTPEPLPAPALQTLPGSPAPGLPGDPGGSFGPEASRDSP